MHLFGLTGGLASGKSAVAARLRIRGVPVIDADLLAREVVTKGSSGLADIVEAFGPEVLDAEGSLDRRALAALVFSDEKKRKTLNAITHPRIAELGMERARELSERGEPLAAYEAALLVENGLESAFRPLVVVAAPPDVQLARAVARDGSDEDEARARLAAQMPLDQKIAAADFVIENASTLAALSQRTDEVLAAICERVGVDPARYPEPH
ncbi:MAG: dephospho-CoA kinase [Polyangiaceae bacterium]